MNWFLTFIIFLCLFSSLHIASNKLNDEEKRYNNEIGKDFIFKGDTLKIVNKSLWYGTFTLDNGLEVNSQLIFNKNKEL